MNVNYVITIQYIFTKFEFTSKCCPRPNAIKKSCLAQIPVNNCVVIPFCLPTNFYLKIKFGIMTIFSHNTKFYF